jgi:hypothetical protein
VRAMGPRGVLYRLWYAAQKKTRYFHWRTPTQPWGKVSLSEWLRTEVPCEPRAYAIWRESQSVSLRDTLISARTVRRDLPPSALARGRDPEVFERIEWPPTRA